MFFPNEIITEILAFSDYQTWINKIKEVNQQYHSYYNLSPGSYKYLSCKRHGLFVANWRNDCIFPNAKKCIYPICVNSDKHDPRSQMISQIKLPHNY